MAPVARIDRRDSDPGDRGGKSVGEQAKRIDDLGARLDRLAADLAELKAMLASLNAKIDRDIITKADLAAAEARLYRTLLQIGACIIAAAHIVGGIVAAIVIRFAGSG